jgi:CRISPR/Cas system-associated endonuclease Cas1
MNVAALKHVEILLWGPRSETVLFAPMIDASRTAINLRLRQFEAVLNPRKTLSIAKAIVAAKLKVERYQGDVARRFAAMLKSARSTDDVRHVEAKAAQIWWRQWADFKLRFAGHAVPAEWHSWPGRYIAEGGKASWAS